MKFFSKNLMFIIMGLNAIQASGDGYKEIFDREIGMTYSPTDAMTDAMTGGGNIGYTKYISVYSEKKLISYMRGLDDLFQITISVKPYSWKNSKEKYKYFLDKHGIKDNRQSVFELSNRIACSLTEEAKSVLHDELQNKPLRPYIGRPSYPSPCSIVVRFFEENEDLVMNLIKRNKLFKIEATIPHCLTYKEFATAPIVNHLNKGSELTDWEGSTTEFLFETSVYFLKKYPDVTTAKKEWIDFMRNFDMGRSKDRVRMNNQAIKVCQNVGNLKANLVESLKREEYQ